MTTSLDSTLSPCARCGSPYGLYPEFGFCPRCAAVVSFTETETAQPEEDELAAVLPRSTAATGGRTRFGDYALLEEIARGGMGVVYRARQRSLNRIVAVKMLLFAGLAGADRLRRFRNEASSAAALEHSHIVRILEVSEHESQPFIVMEFVGGTDLAQLAHERPLAARQAAGYLTRIARAIEFAHQRGVMHRDLKPSNVILDPFDEPRVTDFSLARNLAEDSDVTLTGQALGSPNFMPPEQARGDLDSVGPASDVHGLGAILYYLLTARPPFLAETIEATLASVRDHDPVPPRQLNDQVPRDLETICLKCLEKEPAKRYPTAQALADDLDRFLNDEPILARPVTRLERAVRWCHRKPALAVSSLLLLLVIVIVGSPIAAYRINQSRQLAEAETANSRSILNFLKDDFLVLADPYRVAQPELAPDREIALITAIQQAARRIGSRFENRPLVEAEIRLTIGRALLRLDRLGESKDHLDRAGALYVSVNGENSPAALEVRHELGLLLHQQGRHEDAAASHRRVLAIRRQLLGDDDLAVFQSLNALAASLSVNASNFDEATALYQEVIAKGSKALGEDHALVLEAKSGLSQIAYELGHWDESSRLNEELSRMVERKYGANDPATLQVLARHIWGLRSVPGRFEEAERLREQAIERSRRVLAPDHPTTVLLLADQGFADRDKGLWGTVLRGRREILELVRARYGERDGQTLTAQDRLGGMLRWFGVFKEAEAIHRQSLQIRMALDQKATIAEHRSQRYLVWALFHQGKLEEAEHHQRQILGGVIEAFGVNAQPVFYHTDELAMFLGVQGKWREIAENYKARAALNTGHGSFWPYGWIHLPAGVVAASIAEDEDTFRLICGLMADRFQEVADPQTAAEVALAFLSVEPHLLMLPQTELLRRLLPIVEAEMATSTKARLVGGLASYRFGDAAQAIERLASLLPNPDSAIASCAGYIVAMAHHRLGHPEPAHRALHDANARLAVPLQSGQLDHKGQDDLGYSVQWAEYGRALVLQHQAETTILGRQVSPTVDAQFLKARQDEWSSNQAFLDEFEQLGRRREWQAAKVTLVQALENVPMLLDQYGNRVPDLAHKATVVFAITDDRERYQRLLEQITRNALVDQPYYSLPLLAGLGPQSGLTARIAAECRSRYQPVDVVEIWDRIRWGEAEFRSGHPESALVVLEPALSHHRLEASGIAHAYAALAAMALGRNEQARQFLQTARSK